jgi:hypothetical protein
VKFILNHVNFSLHRVALNLFGISLFTVTLSVVFPFFLVIVTMGTASAGAYALGSRLDERRGRHHGARERESRHV